MHCSCHYGFIWQEGSGGARLGGLTVAESMALPRTLAMSRLALTETTSPLQLTLHYLAFRLLRPSASAMVLLDSCPQPGPLLPKETQMLRGCPGSDSGQHRGSRGRKRGATMCELQGPSAIRDQHIPGAILVYVTLGERELHLFVLLFFCCSPKVEPLSYMLRLKEMST